jgi:hypothetical protein
MLARLGAGLISLSFSSPPPTPPHSAANPTRRRLKRAERAPGGPTPIDFACTPGVSATFSSIANRPFIFISDKDGETDRSSSNWHLYLAFEATGLPLPPVSFGPSFSAYQCFINNPALRNPRPNEKSLEYPAFAREKLIS